MNKFFRYFIGFFLLALILSAFYFSKIMLFIVSAFFIIITMIEYRNMFKEKNIFPHKFLPEITGILCAYIFTFEHDITNHSLITPILLISIIFAFILTVISNKKPYIMTSLSTIAAILLIFCGLYIIKITYYFEQKSAWYLIMVYFSAVLLGDYAASIFFRNSNKKIYIAPDISPQKTLAGCIINGIFSIICTLSLKFLLGFTFWQCITLGIVISVFSQFGDLTISTFKRDLGLKHSGTMFLNYGGILDRMDAFLFSAPITYYYLFYFSII